MGGAFGRTAHNSKINSLTLQLISLPEAQVDAPEGTVPVIDLQNLGKFKLLGKGRIDKPFIVKTRFVSALAEKKIKEAGGVVKLVA
jgi:large subunit ribosomal protein L27Ae